MYSSYGAADYSRQLAGVLRKFGPMPNCLIKKLAQKSPVGLLNSRTKTVIAHMRKDGDAFEIEQGITALSKNEKYNKETIAALWLFAHSSETDLRDCNVCDGFSSNLLSYVVGRNKIVNVISIRSSFDYHILREMNDDAEQRKRDGDDVVVFAIVPDLEIARNAPPVKFPIRYVTVEFNSGFSCPPSITYYNTKMKAVKKYP